MKLFAAKYSHLLDIMKIIGDAQSFLKSMAIDQWQDNYPDQSVIINDIAANEGFIITHNQVIVAYAMISFRKEPSYEIIYDGKWLNNEPYAVLHRMAVSESYRNQGVAQFILNELEIMSLKNNLLNIRVDTHVENLPMRKLLTKNGYLYCGTIYLTNGNKRIAFQKQLTKQIHS